MMSSLIIHLLIIHLVFYFPTLMYLINVRMVLVQKRERGFVTMLWL
jgi:hypothetical protein